LAPANEYLDEATGVTLTRVARPLVFYAEEPMLAVNVRDYIYFAPLAVNRMGQVSRWLWFGSWSTIDRGAQGAATGDGDITAIQLIADGEPVDLDVASARTDPDGARDMPYATPAATPRHLYLPVTSSQVDRLAGARQLALRTEHAGGNSRTWQQWQGEPATLRAFVDLTGGPSAAPVAAASRPRP